LSFGFYKLLYLPLDFNTMLFGFDTPPFGFPF